MNKNTWLDTLKNTSILIYIHALTYIHFSTIRHSKHWKCSKYSNILFYYREE